MTTTTDGTVIDPGGPGAMVSVARGRERVGIRLMEIAIRERKKPHGWRVALALKVAAEMERAAATEAWIAALEALLRRCAS